MSMNTVIVHHADPDRADLDHEVLNARPVDARFDGQESDGCRLYRLHDLLEEPRPGRSRSWSGGLSSVWCHGGA